MHSKPAFAVLVSAIAVAMLSLTGCQESSAPQTQQTPQVGVITLEAKPFTLTSEVPGRTSAYRIA